MHSIFDTWINIPNGSSWLWKYLEGSTICKVYLHPIIYVDENYLCRNAGINRSTIGVTGISFMMLWNWSWTGWTFMKLGLSWNYSVLHKDCLAGYRYKKVAVISEPHTHLSALPKYCYMYINILFQDNLAEACLPHPRCSIPYFLTAILHILKQDRIA